MMKKLIHLAILSLLFVACSTEKRPRMIKILETAGSETETNAPTPGRSNSEDETSGVDNAQDSQPQVVIPAPSAPTNTATGSAIKATGSLVLSATLVQPVNKGPYGMRTTPVHAHAIWITDANDNYVKTINAQAATRSVHLQRWRSFTGTQPDGVTGATVTTNETTGALNSVVWDLKDKSGVVVPNGNYKMWFEWAEANTTATPLNSNMRSTLNQPLDSLAGYSAYIMPFSVGPQGSSKTDTASPVFSNLKVVHTP